jgi:hypothetical protein
MPPAKKDNQMKTDDTNTDSPAGADSLDRIVRKSHAASRPSGLRAIADGLDAPESTISIWQVQECLRVAADKIEMLESKQSLPTTEYCPDCKKALVYYDGWHCPNGCDISANTTIDKSTPTAQHVNP